MVGRTRSVPRHRSYRFAVDQISSHWYIGNPSKACLHESTARAVSAILCPKRMLVEQAHQGEEKIGPGQVTKRVGVSERVETFAHDAKRTGYV